MLYLLWALINLLSGILMLFACLKIFKAIRYRFGLVKSTLFLFLLVSLTSLAPSYQPDEPRTWSFLFLPPGNCRQNYSAVLDNNALFRIRLNVFPDLTRHRDSASIHAFTRQEGGATIQEWTPTTISIHLTNQKLLYKVSGVVSWKLFNCILYRQPREFSGEL